MSKNTDLSIVGMSCQHCVRIVTQALESVPGVVSAKVNLESKSAVVTHDGSVDVGALVAAVKAEEFDASPQ